MQHKAGLVPLCILENAELGFVAWPQACCGKSNLRVFSGGGIVATETMVKVCVLLFFYESYTRVIFRMLFV